MRVPRIYTPQPLVLQQTLTLENAASKHLITVLRLEPGASLILFDGSGHEFDARLEATTDRRAQVRITAERQSIGESPLQVTLAQGISRGERMDYTLEKAVELGVAEIVPVLTERTVVQLDTLRAVRKQRHWQQLVISACEQSGRVRVPVVRLPLSFNGLCAEPVEASLKLLLDPEASASVAAFAHPRDGRVLLLVGPEGGLSEFELTSARRAGFQGVRLGPRTLRTETAALVALSLLQAAWGDLSASQGA